MRQPKLNALRMFDAAARHANFRLAAEELNLTQGAVAQSVRALEADVGVSLFTRLPRGLALTASGEGFHSEIARALAIIDQATRKLHPETNTVTLSVTPSFASKWLVPRLPYFFETQPGIEVKTVASEGVSDFRTDEVDIAVRQEKRPAGRDLVVEKLADQELCVVCDPATAMGLGTVETPDAFTGLPLIQDGHRHWERLLGEAGLELPSPILQFNQAALAMDAAANGQGIAVAPRLLASGDLASGRLVEVWRNDRDTDAGFWLVHPRAEPPNEKARAALAAWLIFECR